MIQSICGKYYPPNNLNLKDPTSFFMQLIFRPFQGWNREPSDPDADDIPMCYHASLIAVNLYFGYKGDLFTNKFLEGKTDSAKILLVNKEVLKM